MTLPIDLRFKGIGRLHLRSGTKNKAVRKAMLDMLRALNYLGRQDVLEALPDFRQDYYMAHGPENLGAHYKRAKECLPYLLADAAAIQRVLMEPATEPAR